MPSDSQVVVVLGTGGTIAGTAEQASDHVGYAAGVLTAQALIAAVPALAAAPVQAESVAQLDSCNMDHATWLALRGALQRHLARPEVCGVVVTHGTDTLEETAYFLHRTLAADKPVVLTAAMRPATALSADGPQNLCDAVAVARAPGVQGVLAVLDGKVWAGHELRKVHGYAVAAFSAGDAGPLAMLQAGRLRSFRPWPHAELHAAAAALPPAESWPVVDIVTSHAQARGAVIEALVAAGAQGLVIAGTGNGSVFHDLQAAAQRAVAAGVPVWRASRCQMGGVVDAPAAPDSQGLPSAGTLTAPQARIEMTLDLMLR
jgi:L-asparaginase